jgi:hypothetical protein
MVDIIGGHLHARGGLMAIILHVLNIQFNLFQCPKQAFPRVAHLEPLSHVLEMVAIKRDLVNLSGSKGKDLQAFHFGARKTELYYFMAFVRNKSIILAVTLCH